jgi:hypothetical protein
MNAKKRLVIFFLALILLVAVSVKGTFAIGPYSVIASFNVTSNPLLGLYGYETPYFVGLSYDPVEEKILTFGNYKPICSPCDSYTIFEFDGSSTDFGNILQSGMVGGFGTSGNASMAFDSRYGILYTLLDDTNRFWIRPNHVYPRNNPPSNNQVERYFQEQGAISLTFDESDNSIVVLQRQTDLNPQQQLTKIDVATFGIVSRTPIIGISISRDSEVSLNPETGNYYISVGAHIYEVNQDGYPTGNSFPSPHNLTIIGMEFASLTQLITYESDGTVSLLGPPNDPPLQVSIDIKPGAFPNTIKMGSGGVVLVAVFSSSTFDARTVDPTTVTLASAGVRLRGNGQPMAAFEDVNHDGLMDIVVHILTEALNLSSTDTEAVLEGQTISGTRIRGVDSVRVVQAGTTSAGMVDTFQERPLIVTPTLEPTATPVYGNPEGAAPSGTGEGTIHEG